MDTKTRVLNAIRNGNNTLAAIRKAVDGVRTRDLVASMATLIADGRIKANYNPTGKPKMTYSVV